MIRAKLSKGGDAKLQGLTVLVDSQLQIYYFYLCIALSYIVRSAMIAEFFNNIGNIDLQIFPYVSKKAH